MFSVATCIAKAQSVLYVDQNANLTPHDGSSWCNAYLTLDEALAVSTSGFTIKVADGTYMPDTTGLTEPRDAVFTMVSGVILQGGYAGCGAANPDARDFELYGTILSGEQGDPANIKDNCYNVMFIIDCDSQTVLDGFTVTRGCTWADVYPYGGSGIFIGGGEPTVSNCIIRDNYTSAVYVSASNPQLVGCRFAENEWLALFIESSTASVIDCTVADNIRGAVSHRYSTSTFSNCVFDNNDGGYGGAIMSYYSDLTVLDSTFTGNTECPGGGGAVHNFDSEFTAARCEFSDNESCTYGGAISGGQVDITDCTFINNRAPWGNGGAIVYAEGTVHNCTFRNNIAKNGAGAMSIAGSVTNCVFENNSATDGWEGGGALQLLSNCFVKDCVFNNNSSQWGGAIMKNIGGGVLGAEEISNCVFDSNSAEQGGVLYALDAPCVTFHNCLMKNNTATIRGGCIAMYASDVKVVGCTLVGNQSPLGGAIALPTANESHLFVSNSILWGNLGSVDPQISVTPPAVATVDHSCVEGGFPGIANIAVDPLFGDADFRLSGTSPCIEAGDNDAMAPTVTTDLDGNPRIAGCFVDMGTYEYQAVVVEPGDVPGDANADCVVDTEDYDEFSGCLDSETPDPFCFDVFDLDGDGSIDLADIALYQQMFE